MKVKGHSGTSAAPCSQAFSLVEVALAIAIIGFSLLAVVGLLPSLLKTERDIGFHSLLPRLASQAMGEMRARPYPASFGVQDLIYFNEGLQVVPASSADIFYSCTPRCIAVPPPTTAAASSGGIPDVANDACIVTFEWRFVLENRPPVKTYATLAKEK
ncbi:MAG TPA: hypothetical protein VK956_15780 [Verrucomicrobium sp.]|nr:hypothetical protein [Verrucomicrobium sp.]